MKYFVVTTKNKLGSTKVIYPDNYQQLIDISATEGCFYFRDENDSGVFKRLHTVPDSQVAKAREFAIHKDVVEITEQQAFDLSDKYQGGMKVDDEAQVRLIEIKVKQGQALTTNEMKAIDPDDNTVKGIAKRKTLKDKINKIKAMTNET